MMDGQLFAVRHPFQGSMSVNAYCVQAFKDHLNLRKYMYHRRLHEMHLTCIISSGFCINKHVTGE